MFGILAYPSFVLSSVLLHMTPGADSLYILSRSVVGGRKEGLVSALGISAGILLHTMLAAFGLSVLFAQSVWAFRLIKWLGAAYLGFMGIKTLLSKQSLFAGEDSEPRSMWPVFRQGMFTNALNPKAILFFLAFLPQFVAPQASGQALPFLLLGLSFSVTSMLWSVCLVMAASVFRDLLKRRPKIQTVASKGAGVVYLALGLQVLRAKMEG